MPIGGRERPFAAQRHDRRHAEFAVHRGREFVGGRRRAQHPGHGRCLGLVDQQHVERGDQRLRQQLHRRRVQHHAGTARPRAGGRRDDRGQRHLELQQQRRPGFEALVGQPGGVGQRVGAGDHGDRVLPASIDVDQRHAGGRTHTPDAGEVDAAGGQQRQRGRRERVVADRGDQAHLAPGPRGGERLVGALAAGQHRERLAGERFPRLRQARDARDEVEVHRTEDDDHRAGSGVAAASGPITPLTSRMLP